MKAIAILSFIVGSVLTLSINSVCAGQGWDETTVRYRLADSQLGNVIGFYRQDAKNEDNPNSVEVIRRWDAGVRCTNLEKFERKIVQERGWMVVHKGTDVPINGLDVALTTDKPKESKKPKFDETQVRFRLADSQLGGVIDYYRHHAETEKDATSIEAVRRWDAGVRCTNLEKFERKIVEGRGWTVVHKGTSTSINGLDVRLSSDD